MEGNLKQRMDINNLVFHIVSKMKIFRGFRMNSVIPIPNLIVDQFLKEYRFQAGPEKDNARLLSADWCDSW